ncbi:hypothetical protein EC973_000541 [Apophysomyces ossiformis]|uniref:(d)CMP kinase n=1 Tax=Apophysomyces ossiformis TaxID=679940 RepID=A0A8H7BUX3_9FUNG|nr:hypothetical protein EC973_000541 [Apophysomyces ossiformis]
MASVSRLFRIAIDGPAASGKSEDKQRTYLLKTCCTCLDIKEKPTTALGTTAKRLAKRLGFGYLDSGAMYRAVTLKCLEKGIDPNDPKTQDQVSAVAMTARIRFPALGKVELDGQDVSEAIRTSAIVRHIQPVAANPAVRQTLANQQRAMARGDEKEEEEEDAWPGFVWQSKRVRGVVMDGRDIGTVILPDAELKVFVVADPFVRAQRRFAELQAKEPTITVEAIARDLVARDEADRTRLTSPLKKAEDAEELDTSHCTIDEQVESIEKMVHHRLDRFLKSQQQHQ